MDLYFRISFINKKINMKSILKSHFLLLWLSKIHKFRIYSVVEVVEKKGSHIPLVEMQTGTAPTEGKLTMCTRSEDASAFDPVISLLEICSTNIPMHLLNYVFIRLFIIILLLIAKDQNKPQLSANRAPVT